jgi:hypothetical protein
MLNDGVFLAFLAVILLLLGYLLYRLISCKNDLEWADLVATRGRLNSYKIGFWVGVVVGSWVVIKQVYMGQLDASIFGIYMMFLTGAPVAMAAIGTRSSAAPRPADKPLSRGDPVID